MAHARRIRTHVASDTRAVADHDLTVLPIAMTHALQAARLPLHHKDPFDRVLVAQAQCEGLTLATVDPLIRAYSVPVLWAGSGSE